MRDYVAVLNLELVIDESEGYAFLRNRPETGDDHSKPHQQHLPRLIAHRPLSFPVSLLLALLRKKLAEFDARLAVYQSALAEMASAKETRGAEGK